MEILGDIFFLQGYVPHIWEHGWSLAVEEHFYILLPLLLLLLLRTGNNFKLIPLISIAASVLCLWLRILALHRGGGWADINYPTHLRIDALFAGVAIGYYSHFDSASFRESRAIWFPIGGTIVALVGILIPLLPITLTLLYIGFSCVVAWAANRPQSTDTFTRVLAWIGFYSYSIYLWHPVVALAFYQIREHWWRFPAYVATAVVSGVVMAKLIEIPALKLREKLFPRVQPIRSESLVEVPKTIHHAVRGAESPI